MHLARFAVELEIDVAGAVFLQPADGIELDDQRFARLDIDAHLVADFQPVEEDRRRQERGVAVLLAVAVELLENPRIEHRREDFAVADRMPELLLHLRLLGGKIDRLEQFAGTAGERLLPFEDDLLQPLGEAAVRLADHPLEEVDHPLREGQFLPRLVKTSSGCRLFCTMNIAMSPTIFDDGVTLITSPNMSLTLRYISLHSSQRWPRPSPSTCGL